MVKRYDGPITRLMYRLMADYGPETASLEEHRATWYAGQTSTTDYDDVEVEIDGVPATIGSKTLYSMDHCNDDLPLTSFILIGSITIREEFHHRPIDGVKHAIIITCRDSGDLPASLRALVKGQPLRELVALSATLDQIIGWRKIEVIYPPSTSLSFTIDASQWSRDAEP